MLYSLLLKFHHVISWLLKKALSLFSENCKLIFKYPVIYLWITSQRPIFLERWKLTRDRILRIAWLIHETIVNSEWSVSAENLVVLVLFNLFFFFLSHIIIQISYRIFNRLNKYISWVLLSSYLKQSILTG